MHQGNPALNRQTLSNIQNFQLPKPTKDTQGCTMLHMDELVPPVRGQSLIGPKSTPLFPYD